MGHADFYLNGGLSPQPGCELEVVLPRMMVLEKCEWITMYIEIFIIKRKKTNGNVLF